jgi:hypothetical protein
MNLLETINTPKELMQKNLLQLQAGVSQIKAMLTNIIRNNGVSSDDMPATNVR